MVQTTLRITPYAREHREEVLTLTYYSQWIHKHLDWYKPGQWIDNEEGIVYLAWEGDMLVGYIGLSKPLNNTTWIRLLGIREDRSPHPIIMELWRTAEAQAIEMGVIKFAVLMVTSWLSIYLGDMGFTYLEDIITLNRVGDNLPIAPETSVKVYSANADDIHNIARIDQLAFNPPWQMTESEIWQAYRISASATVALLDYQIVGYQISTRHRASGHLARLAVHPNMQGKRIGAALLFDLLNRFIERGIKSVTVNTQTSNKSSQRLYIRYGFARNGFDLAVWEKDLDKK